MKTWVAGVIAGVVLFSCSFAYSATLEILWPSEQKWEQIRKPAHIAHPLIAIVPHGEGYVADGMIGCNYARFVYVDYEKGLLAYLLIHPQEVEESEYDEEFLAEVLDVMGIRVKPYEPDDDKKIY